MSSSTSGPLANSVNRPNSTALSSVLEPQYPKPNCMIASGVVSSAIKDLLRKSVQSSFAFFCCWGNWQRHVIALQDHPFLQNGAQLALHARGFGLPEQVVEFVRVSAQVVEFEHGPR